MLLYFFRCCYASLSTFIQSFHFIRFVVSLIKLSLHEFRSWNLIKIKHHPFREEKKNWNKSRSSSIDVIGNLVLQCDVIIHKTNLAWLKIGSSRFYIYFYAMLTYEPRLSPYLTLSLVLYGNKFYVMRIAHISSWKRWMKMKIVCTF